MRMFSSKMYLLAAVPLLLCQTMSRGVSAAVMPDPNIVNTKRDIWQPAVGLGWQIELKHSLTDTTPNVPVYDIDLFDNTAATITALHDMGRKVICYFSAGSYENWRPDASSWTASDYGNPVAGWSGEWWANTKSSNVRDIMAARLDLAASKGCDGVDPDNVDAYANDNGLCLTTTDAVDYVTYLANAAHERGLAIGLKNAGDIVPDVLALMQWEVNEQCGQYSECDTFQAFISEGKPVFRIEYPADAPNPSQATISSICGDSTAAGFSTIMKESDLDDWVLAC